MNEHQGIGKDYVIDRDDLKILACTGEVPSLEIKQARSSDKDPRARRKMMMEQAIGRAVSEFIQWTEETMPDGSVKMRAELYCIGKDPR